MSVTYLEAHRLVAGFTGGPPLSLLLGVSGAADKLNVFLKAAGARRGRSVEVRTLPFNTLGQALLAEPMAGHVEVFVLFPWDLAPEGDWRSGFPAGPIDAGAARAHAQAFADRLARRPNARVLYVPAALPPVFPDTAATRAFELWLSSVATELGAEFLDPGVFSLGSYLSTGTPFAGTQLSTVAERVVERALNAAVEPAKVLVTDLDNVMWSGIIGEDGLDGIRFTSEGVGFRHFLYQTFLAKLKREGTLIAAVSRNDTELATAPFASGRMMLRTDDLVVIAASYNAKSTQIREIARQLNLGLDAFVFVDDNPIELEEVSSALPDVRVIRFPTSDDRFPEFFDTLSRLFPRTVVTTEDADRTNMYRRRLDGMVPDASAGADLTAFLRGLEMSLVINDRSRGDRTRAVQLINKTNQFNLNGRRVTDDEVAAMLANGGRLYTASLGDRTGSHGEVLACLVDADRVVRSLVMSCRVFQRRMEHAFLVWLAAQHDPPAAFDFTETPRNEPIRQFLDDSAFQRSADNVVTVDLAAFAEAHEADSRLFVLEPPQ